MNSSCASESQRNVNQRCEMVYGMVHALTFGQYGLLAMVQQATEQIQCVSGFVCGGVSA